MSACGLGWGGRRWFRWRPIPVPPPPPPTLYWRLAPDIAPALSLHLGDGRGVRERETGMGWRVAGGEPLVCLRGLQPQAGESR